MRTGRRNISEAGGNAEETAEVRTGTTGIGTGAAAEEISYLIDLTLPYRNMLSITEGNAVGSAPGRDSETLFLNDGITAEGINAESGSREFYTCDEYGSPARYTDENGNTTGLFGYEEYGTQTNLLSEAETRTYGTAGCNAVISPFSDAPENRNRNENRNRHGNIHRPFTFTGYMEDEVSGLYFAQAREYDPVNGRFAGKDWVKGLADRPYTLNEYGYCWNNPKKYEDKDGRIPTVVIGAIVGGAIGGLFELGNQIMTGMQNGQGFGESLANVNWWEVGIQTVVGAGKGAVAGTGIGVVYVALADGGIDAVGSVATELIVNKEKNVDVIVENATTEFVVGATTSYLGSSIGSNMKIFADIDDVDAVNKVVTAARSSPVVAQTPKAIKQWNAVMLQTVSNYAEGEVASETQHYLMKHN